MLKQCVAVIFYVDECILSGYGSDHWTQLVNFHFLIEKYSVKGSWNQILQCENGSYSYSFKSIVKFFFFGR